MRQTAKDRKRERFKCSGISSLKREKEILRETKKGSNACVFVCVCLLAKNCAWTFGNDVSNSSEKRKSKLLLLKRAQAEQISRPCPPFSNWAVEHRRRRGAFVLQETSPLPSLRSSIKFRDANKRDFALCACVCVQGNCNRLTCRLITVWGQQKQRQQLEMCQIWRQT